MITAGENERWASRADFCGNGGFLASFYQRIPEFHSQLLNSYHLLNLME